MTALQTLRGNAKALARLQDEAATGLRVAEAAHNASYWSISVAMKSTMGANHAVMDSLGLTTALVDVTYAALTQVESNLSLIKDKLVLSEGDGADTSKIQNEIHELAQQILTAVDSAQFAGGNLLRTNVEHIWEAPLDERARKYTASYMQTDQGISIGTIDIDLLKTSLVNGHGGGILEPDPRSPKSLGGIRLPAIPAEFQVYDDTNHRSGGRATSHFTFVGPFTMGDDAYIRFELEVDKESPDHGLPGPLLDGTKTLINITKSDIVSALPGSNGTVSSWGQWMTVLNTTLGSHGVAVSDVVDWLRNVIPNRYALSSSETTGHNGSSIIISNLEQSAGIARHGLVESASYGSAPRQIHLAFEPFKIYRDVVATMRFHINGQEQALTIDRDTVDQVLRRDDGRVDTPAHMTALLSHLVGDLWNIKIEESGAGVTLSVDTDVDRTAGRRTNIGFSGISVNIEPIISYGLLDIDVETNPDLVTAYLSTIDVMHAKTVSAAAYIGSIKTRVELQKEFTSKLIDAFERGMSQLADADMETPAARLTAEQVRQQLVLRALSISNSAPQNLLSLFQ